MENYRDKYLKYKKKYMQKKFQQYGGQVSDTSDFQNDPNVITGNQVVPNPKFAINEVFFWGNQMKEHAEVAHLSLELPEEKNLAFELMNKWDQFMKKEFVNKGVQIELANYNNPTDVKVEMTDQDFSKININQFDFATLFTLLSQLRQYEQSIITRLNNGEWLGWLYLSYAQHILMELDTFERRIKGQISPMEDLEFYVQMSQEHTGVAEKLTDKLPENFNLEEILRQSYNKAPLPLKDNKDEMQQIILTSFKYIQEVGATGIDLQKKILNKEYKGLLRQDVIDHVVREQVKAEKMVLKLKNSPMANNNK